MKTHFVERLIKVLIENDIIKEGITIPYLIQAYKIKDSDDTPISQEYIQYVFQDIIEDNSHPFWIRICSTIKQLSIKLASADEQSDFHSNNRYKYICNMQGNPIIYFEEYFDCSNPTIENISKLFWDKYKDTCFIPQKFSYVYHKWVNIAPLEVDIIKSII